MDTVPALVRHMPLLHSMHNIPSLEYLEIFDSFAHVFYYFIVGFSAVLFSLKFILNQQEDTMSSIYGLHVASKYICWLEVFIIQMIYPNASFLGHLCGIVAGALCYYLFIPLISKFQRSLSYQSSQGRMGRTIGRRI